ncbi:MAG: hypothetical protein MUP70_02065 [Candidatus Aminicenantes bacterium]|nr:hypothetical protein [Candidatus Aminicenantes bacterium]
MSGVQREGAGPLRAVRSLMSNPIIPFIGIGLFMLLLAITLLSGCNRATAQSEDQSNSLFPLADLAETVSYEILQRKTFSYSDIIRIQFKVQMAGNDSKQNLQAVAQKIVRDTILKNKCHTISIDFGRGGFVDFAPYGKWTMAGEAPILNYKDYRFRYAFY